MSLFSLESFQFLFMIFSSYHTLFLSSLPFKRRECDIIILPYPFDIVYFSLPPTLFAPISLCSLYPSHSFHILPFPSLSPSSPYHSFSSLPPPTSSNQISQQLRMRRLRLRILRPLRRRQQSRRLTMGKPGPKRTVQRLILTRKTLLLNTK